MTVAQTVTNNANRVAAGLIAVYAVALFAALPVLSFWTDELIQLSVVQQPSFGAFVKALLRDAGAAPFGYLPERLTVWLFGANALGARLPPLLSGLLACAGVFRLAKHLRMGAAWLPVIIFAAFPLQIRYSLEARPYSQALMFSVWATLYFLKCIERPGWRELSLYYLLSVAAIFS